MEYLYIPVQAIDSAEFLGAEPVDRATWLCLMRYCIGQENGGRILECTTWGDRKWQQLCRVTLSEVRRECDLWAWEEFNLAVEFYPHDRVTSHQELSRQGKEKALTRWKRANGLGGASADDHASNSQDDAPAMPRHPIAMPAASKSDAVLGEGVSGVNGLYEGRGAPAPPARTAQSKSALASSWADRNPNLVQPMVEQFSRSGTTVKDVLDHWKVMFTLKGRPLNGEWLTETAGQQPVEVFLCIAHAPEGSVTLPSTYRTARKNFEITEKAL